MVESFVVLAVDFVFASVLLGDVGDGKGGGFTVDVVGKVVIFLDIFAVLGPADLKSNKITWLLFLEPFFVQLLCQIELLHKKRKPKNSV